MRDHRTGAVLDRAHVVVGDPVEHLFVHRLERQGRLRHAGIVDQYVETAEGPSTNFLTMPSPNPDPPSVTMATFPASLISVPPLPEPSGKTRALHSPII